jgi:hypothetical protein
MRWEMGEKLSREWAEELKNQGERDFALACLEVGCEVYYQIAVGDSMIDFYVVNPKTKTEGKLVEVTMEKRLIWKKYIHKVWRSEKKVVNTTGLRKQRQLDSMMQSGHKWTMLFDEEVSNLKALEGLERVGLGVQLVESAVHTVDVDRIQFILSLAKATICLNGITGWESIHLYRFGRLAGGEEVTNKNG